MKELNRDTDYKVDTPMTPITPKVQAMNDQNQRRRKFIPRFSGRYEKSNWNKPRRIVNDTPRRFTNAQQHKTYPQYQTGQQFLYVPYQQPFQPYNHFFDQHTAMYQQQIQQQQQQQQQMSQQMQQQQQQQQP